MVAEGNSFVIVPIFRDTIKGLKNTIGSLARDARRCPRRNSLASPLFSENYPVWYPWISPRAYILPNSEYLPAVVTVGASTASLAL